MGLDVVITTVSAISMSCHHASLFVSRNACMAALVVCPVNWSSCNKRVSCSRSAVFWSTIEDWWSWVVFNSFSVGLCSCIGLFECSHVVFTSHHLLTFEDRVGWDQNRSLLHTCSAVSQLYCLLFYCACSLRLLCIVHTVPYVVVKRLLFITLNRLLLAITYIVHVI